ncbi:probable G-protein coupled receptor 150 isoform X1 [Peromyscus californicus insignis]|uniref:probable G-protein coupled receptor 150 isoform X1 n=1 Tax=Peromyscus californicus insignis TaxID=564181 RepID=UPI0022A7573F|nr:probable G-protein coupled receptor 150 isoform X1 [Peromyscus californicus insignis]
MEAPFSPSVLPPAPNLSLSILPSWSLNLTSGQATSVPGPQPPPRRPPSHPIHLVFMGIILVTAVAGNTTVLCRLCGGSSRPWPGPKRRKMDFLLVQLAAADLYACGGTALSQLAWELLGDPRPALGDLACRFSQLLQASGRGASAHLVALIALERQLAVRRPQGPQLPARALAALGWLLALLLALPPTFVVRWGAPPPPAASAWPGEHRCGGIFAPLPRWHLQIYTLYEAIVGFAAPVAIMGVSCGHLLCVWWQRGSQAPVAGAPWSASPARAPLPSALPRAKVQSLKMSLSLALLFVGCELPYFAARLAAAWSSEPTGDWEGEGLVVAMRVVEAANSALNPFVYLFFQAGDCGLWWRLRRRLGVVCCVREAEAEINEGAGDHQALHRHRWPHPHYHHARREERDKGYLRPPPPRPRPLSCSCESPF